jgi:hypothetical protein
VSKPDTVENFPMKVKTYCRPCGAAKNAEWRTANPERARASVQRWIATHKEQYAEVSATWRSKHREEACRRSRAWRLQRVGLTEEKLAALTTAQEGRCKLCRRQKKTLVVKVRGTTRCLLCRSCVLRLPLIEKIGLERVVAYIVKHEGRHAA